MSVFDCASSLLEILLEFFPHSDRGLELLLWGKSFRLEFPSSAIHICPLSAVIARDALAKVPLKPRGWSLPLALDVLAPVSVYGYRKLELFQPPVVPSALLNKPNFFNMASNSLFNAGMLTPIIPQYTSTVVQK